VITAVRCLGGRGAHLNMLLFAVAIIVTIIVKSTCILKGA